MTKKMSKENTPNQLNDKGYATYYTQCGIELDQILEILLSTEFMVKFCIANVLKYQFRSSNKAGECPIKRKLKMKCYKEIAAKFCKVLGTPDEKKGLSIDELKEVFAKIIMAEGN